MEQHNTHMPPPEKQLVMKEARFLTEAHRSPVPEHPAPTAMDPRPAPTPPPLQPRGGAEQAPDAPRTRSAAPGRAVPGGAELRGAAQIPGQLLADLDLVAERGVAERAVHQHLEGLAELEVVPVETHVLLGVLLPRDLHGGAAGSRAEGRGVPCRAVPCRAGLPP